MAANGDCSSAAAAAGGLRCHQQRRRQRRQQQLMLPPLLLLAALACVQQRAAAFPSLFVARDANGCTDHPSASFGKVHDYTSAPDRTVSFALTSKATGRAVAAAANNNGGAAGRVCAGDEYALRLDFGAPSARNFLLTSTHGSLTVAKNDCDAWCPNRVCSPAPTTGTTVGFKLPCGTAPGTAVTLKVTSANGRIPTPGSTLRSATLSLIVDGASCSKCGGGGGSSVTTERGSKSA